MPTIHKELAVLERHPVHNREFAGAAQREAFTYTADDIGSVVRQLDDNSYWMVTSVAPTFDHLGFGYKGFEDYNDTSTSSGVAITANTWTSVPNNGLGAFTNKTYSPGVGDLMNASGQIDPTNLALGDVFLVRHDIRVTPAVNGAFLSWRHELGTGGGTYHLESPLGSLTDGARQYAFQFTNLIYMGDTNTRDNLITPQIKCSEACTLINLGSSITVWRR